MKLENSNLPDTYFKSVEFTLKIGCSVGCTFCPQQVLLNNYKSNVRTFTLTNFIKALDNLLDSPVKTIKFSGYSEPLENELVYDFIKYANERNFKIELITTLKNFNKEAFLKIKDLPIRVHISVQPFGANNRLGLKDNIAWSNIEDLLETRPTCEVIFGCLDNNLSEEDKSKLDIKAASLKMRIKYERLTSRAGYLNNLSHPDLYGKKILCKHNMEPIILPNGDMALCCMDFGLRHLVGNIFEQKYNEMLKNPSFIDLLDIMTAKKKGEILCHTCEYAKPVPYFFTVSSYANFRQSLRKLRDSVLPKKSILRNKLNDLFKK